MADQFIITPPVVRPEGKDVPPEQIQAGFNSLARQTQIGLNSVASDPSGPASGDLGGTYPAPTVVAVHAVGGTLDGVVIGGTTPAAATVTTLTANTPVAVTSGGTGRNALTANAVVIGEGSSQVNFAAPGVAGTLLASNGVAADPTFQTKTTLTIASSGANTDITSLNAPALGAATATTAAAHTNTTQVATTAFVETEFASPPTAGVGSVTPSPGAFTNLSSSGTVSGTGFTNLFASPPSIGNSTPGTGAFTTLSSTGNFTPSQTNGIVGTTTNNNANAGSVGEHVTATGTGIALSTGVSANITSISLTAGDWELNGSTAFLPAAGTTIAGITTGISTTSATLPVVPFSAQIQATLTTGLNQGLTAPSQRFSLSGTTTVFLVANAGFGTSTMTATGTIRARRVR